jgi:hypothetical protein
MKLILPIVAVVTLLVVAGCQSDPYRGYQSEAYGPPEAANVPLAISDGAPMLLDSGRVVRAEVEESVRRNPWLLELSGDLRNEVLRCVETVARLDPLYAPSQDPDERERKMFELLVQGIDEIGAGDTSRFATQCPETMSALNAPL